MSELTNKQPIAIDVEAGQGVLVVRLRQEQDPALL